jgi:NADH-quinone oxidoreductase subunit L
MGGLRKIMPVTFLTYAVGMMALSGVPLFFSGAWTKEEILQTAAHWPASPIPWYLMLVGVVLTALYMTRQIIYVFFGKPREAAAHPHESPATMTIPLIILALCTVLLSVVLAPAWPWLHDYLMGEVPQFNIARLFQPVLFLSLALVSLGIGLGWLIYRHASLTSDPLERAQPAVFRFLEQKMWLDELYAITVVALAKFAARFSDWMDRYIWDGLVRAVGGLGQLTGTLSKGFDEQGINSSVDEASRGARGVGRLISFTHSGQIQAYLGAIALGMLALLLFYAWLA